MKKLISFILLVTVSVSSFGQQSLLYNEDNNYGFGPGFLAKEALYDIIRTIEQPSAVPSFEDSLSYFEGLRIRREDSQRAEMAAKDAIWSIEALSTWSEAVGIEISREQTPVLFYLISRSAEDGDNLICAVKGKYFRERAYSYFKEEPDGLPDRERLRRTSSYPSGHSCLSGVISAILVEVFPKRAAFILERGTEFCASRWILGFHFKSDTSVGYLIGFQVVSRLHADPTFQATLRAAKYEVQQHDVELYPYKGEQHKLRPYE